MVRFFLPTERRKKKKREEEMVLEFLLIYFVFEDKRGKVMILHAVAFDLLPVA